MRYLGLLCLMIAVIVLGCNTNPPVAVQEENGYIKVTSNVEGATIYLDGKDTQKLTPTTITAVKGNHTIKVSKDGIQSDEKNITVIAEQTTNVHFDLSENKANRIVLLEDFANVSCDPCVISNQILHNLQKKYKDQIAIIKFPVNFPSPNDPFYLHAKGDCDNRSSYYKIFAAPTVFVNGKIKPIATDSNSIKSAIDNELSKSTPFDISIAKSIKDSKIEIKADIKALSDDIKLENLVIHTVILEEEIEFANPPGGNGEKKFYDVMRKMLPNADGQKMELTNKIQTIQHSVDIHSKWNTAKLKTVVFVQNKVTKEVFQAGIR